MLKATYDEATVKKFEVLEWHKTFKDGQEDMKNYGCSGCSDVRKCGNITSGEI